MALRRTLHAMSLPPASSSLGPLRIAVCGVGLIGGSIVRALRVTGRPLHITGLDRDAALLQRLRTDGWIDAIAEDGGALFDAHDLVVLCQPVGVLLDFIRTHARRIGAGRAVCFDVASVKGPVVAALEEGGAAAFRRFVPSHPIAGKAQHGWAAAEAELFADKRCILTPDARTDANALARVRAFWSMLGAQVSSLPAAEHDSIYAGISHLPQLLTYAYLHSLATRPEAARWPAHQGSGYRGFTRLGSSDPALWADIALHNRQPLIEEIDRLGDALALMRHQLAAGDAVALADAFALARRFHAAGAMPDPAEGQRPSAHPA